MIPGSLQSTWQELLKRFRNLNVPGSENEEAKENEGSHSFSLLI